MINKFAITGSADVTVDPNTGYSEISKYLQLFGMTETTIENCDSLIFVNYNNQSYKKYKKLGKKDEDLVLIRLEPEAVFPVQYRKSVEKKFGLIIDPGRKIEKASYVDFIGWPYKYNLNPSTPNHKDPKLNFAINEAITNGFFDFENWSQRIDKVVLIADNKVSPTAKSNYKIRRKISKQLSSHEIDIYGDLWDSTLARKFLYRVSILYSFVFYLVV